MAQVAINQRIKILRSGHNLTQDEFAKKIGISRESLASIESGKQLPTIKQLTEIVRNYNTNYDWLLDGIESIGTKHKPIPVLDHRAAAGWPNEPNDPQFFKDLPTITLPFLDFRSGNFIAIQVAGDSMHPTIYSGDWLFCKQVVDRAEVSFGSVYVLVTRNGVVCKRIKTDTDPELVVLASDNETYEPYTVLKDEILANGLWEVMYKMTAVLGNNGNHNRLESLERSLRDMMAQVVGLKKGK